MTATEVTMPARAKMPGGKGKRVPLNMRTTQEVRDRLAQAAADSGRSLVQEVEYRIERSFLEQDFLARGNTDSKSAEPMTASPAQIDQVRVRVLPDGRMSLTDAAKYLGLAPSTLRSWDLEGKGPASVLVGGRRFYFKETVDAFISGQAAA